MIENQNATTLIETGPTETSFYTLNILNRYKILKIFKKRFLVKRNNKFGIGFRKRIIPTKKLLEINRYILEFQQKITDRIPDILEIILNDEKNEDPIVHNFLKVIRKWLLEFPLAVENFYDVKWYERKNFERVYKSYLINYFSFSMLDFEISEKILVCVEDSLRKLPDLQKQDILKEDSEFAKASKENTNIDIEKYIYEFLMILRSFLSDNQKEKTYLSEHLKKKYKNLDSLFQYIYITSEALIFQKAFTIKELVNYFEVKPAVVNAHAWDMSKQQLKKYGKDPETIKQKKIENLKQKIFPYRLIKKMLNVEITGKNLLDIGVVEQWRLMDFNKKNNPEEVYSDNYLYFLDTALNYFKNLFYPILKGSEIIFKNKDNNEITGKIFDLETFSKIANFEKIMNEFHYFKTNNPILTVTRKEILSIYSGQLKTMINLHTLLNSISSFFYQLGHELLVYYAAHVLWFKEMKKDKKLKELKVEKTYEVLGEGELENSPFPYYNYLFIDYVVESSKLSKSISGRKVIGENLYSGVIFHMISFCFQLSKDCFNENLNIDIRKEKEMLRSIRMLQKKDEKK